MAPKYTFRSGETMALSSHDFVLAKLPHIQASRTAPRGATCRSVASSQAASGVALSTGIALHVRLEISKPALHISHKFEFAGSAE